MNDALQTARESIMRNPELPLDGILIGVDFDSTCVTHAYPAIGHEIPECVKTLQALVKKGARLILYTMRSDVELMAAVQWMRDHHVELWAINHNPMQHRFSSSRKVYADIYIDDSALGTPMQENLEMSLKPFVDWTKVRELLEKKLGVKLDAPVDNP